jgi:hypothetical protein
LAGLSEQDQRCGVGRLGREREVEEDEWIGVPAEAERRGVESDPDDDQYGLPDDEARRTEEACEALGGHTEAIVPERPMVDEPAWRVG